MLSVRDGEAHRTIRIVGMSQKNDADNQKIRQVRGLSADYLLEEKLSLRMMDSEAIGVRIHIGQEETLKM